MTLIIRITEPDFKIWLTALYRSLIRMLTFVVAVIELIGAAALGTIIVADLVAAAKRRLSPVKVPAKTNRPRR